FRLGLSLGARLRGGCDRLRRLGLTVSLLRFGSGPAAPLSGPPQRRDLDPGQFLTVTVAALVAALWLELHDSQLRTAFMAEDPGLDGHPGEVITVDDVGAVDEQQRLERDGLTVGGGQALDEQRLTFLHPVLLSTCLDDRVHD